MKGLKCNNSLLKTLLSWLFLPCLLVSSLLLASSSASAFGITGTDQYAIQEAYSGFGTAINNAQGIWTRIYTLQKAGDDYWVNLPASGLSAVTVMSLKLNKNIPANSLVSLSVTWTTESVTSTGFIYHSLQFEHNRSLLWDSCINFAGQPIYSSDKFMTLTCNYVFYNASGTNIIDSIYGSHIWEVIHQGDVDDHVNVVIRQPTSVQLSNDGLTYSDRLWLQQNMPGASEAQIEQAVKDANDASREEEKQEIQDASDDAVDSAESAGQQSEAQMTTLLGAFSAFVNTVSSIEPTNCLIDMDVGYFNYRNIDLCQLWTPPQWVSVIASITMIGIMVPLSISAAKKFIQLVRSFTG